MRMNFIAKLLLASLFLNQEFAVIMINPAPKSGFSKKKT
jgi:hypothetical protein